ncbi:hypothetical protein WISP_05259 [Willisornis vidua]|uniref:Integrase catalytic domain-containing protein n=1 Tax=Willisornis vidua TaxID=1566151 RepID=A0ABQ9DT39_9PASS|nr:hypothetical protein WISP_05259 [Willisornis vidua]
MDHFKRDEAKTENENTPSKTHDVPVQFTKSGVQAQQKDNAASEIQTQAANPEIVTSTKSIETAAETQTQVKASMVSTCSVGTQTQATKLKITIDPIKKKKAWMKQTAEPTDPSPRLERVEEEEVEEEEEPTPSTKEVADEGAAADEGAVIDEGAAVREEEMAMTMEGATAREERVVTIVEGAAAREEEVVTGDGALLKGLGAHPKELVARPKESRGVPKKRKEMVQVTQGRASLDELYPDYILGIPEHVRRRSTCFRQLEEEPFPPLQMQSSLGGVVPPPHAKLTLEGIDDWGRPLSQHLKDYLLPPSISGEGEERNNECFVHEEDPRGKDPKGRKEGSQSLSCSRSLHAAHEKTGRPKSKTQNERGLLWGLLHKLGENMKEWDGKPTFKLEAQLQELKQNLASKKAVHIVEAKTLEKEHRSLRCKRSNSVNSDGGASDGASLKSDGEYSDKEQLLRGPAFCQEEERDQDDNWVYWAVWVRWPGTSDPQRYQALVDTGAQCTLVPLEHESIETVSISGVTGGSQELSVVETDMSLMGDKREKQSIVMGPEAPCILGMDYLKRGHFKDPKGYWWAFGVATVIEEKSKQLSTLPGLSKDPSDVGLLRVKDQEVLMATATVHRRQYRANRDAVIPIHKMIRKLESQGVAALEKGEAPEHIQYINDVIVWGETAEEVFRKGQQIIQFLLKASFAIKKSKVKGPAREIHSLGVKWQEGLCQIPTDIINKIIAMAPPTSKKETQAFLGAIGFWRMHIPEYSQTVSPLYFVTHKKNDFQWGPEQQQVFKQIKQEIAHAVALGLVRTDQMYRMCFILQLEIKVSPGAPGKKCLVIHNCETCAAIKQAKRLKPLWYGGHWYKYTYREAWQVDYITLPQTSPGKCYVLTIMEVTSGWLETYSVPHAMAWNTILGLEKQALRRHGTPDHIELDNGTHFKNNLVATWARKHGIEWVYHIPYHAPAAVKVETCNGLLKTTLKALGKGIFKNWDEHLAKATSSVNTRGSVNRAGPAQTESFHMVDGDKVPAIHLRGMLGKSVWTSPSGQNKPIRGIVFARRSGNTWWVMRKDGEIQCVPQGNLALGKN